jgi:hypothetical protein
MVVLLALIPVATMVPALVALALAAAVCATLIAYEALRYRYARTWIRDHRGEFTIEEVRRYAGPGGAPSSGEETSTDRQRGARRRGGRSNGDGVMPS